MHTFSGTSHWCNYLPDLMKFEAFGNPWWKPVANLLNSPQRHFLEKQLTVSWRRPLPYRNQPIDLQNNQWTGFYMTTTPVMKELMSQCITRIPYTKYVSQTWKITTSEFEKEFWYSCNLPCEINDTYPNS